MRYIIPSRMWLIGVLVCFLPALAQTAGTLSTSPLLWNPDHLDVTPKPDDLEASVSFAVTNASDATVIIDRVKPSCSCTVARLPSNPWRLSPHGAGNIAATINLMGKAGVFTKTLTVFFADSNYVPERLTITVKMPDRRQMRARNMLLARADRQAVFHGQCAQCHAEPARTLAGRPLYHAVCGICHEARPRDTLVPDLRLLKHPTDYNFWKTMITYGKPGTMMPAFAQSQGGPLTSEQIDDLARTCDRAMPYARFARPAQTSLPVEAGTPR